MALVGRRRDRAPASPIDRPVAAPVRVVRVEADLLELGGRSTGRLVPHGVRHAIAPDVVEQARRAAARPVWSDSGSPSSWPAATASEATAREWPVSHGDLRSAIVAHQLEGIVELGVRQSTPWPGERTPTTSSHDDGCRRRRGLLGDLAPRLDQLTGRCGQRRSISVAWCDVAFQPAARSRASTTLARLAMLDRQADLVVRQPIRDALAVGLLEGLQERRDDRSSPSPSRRAISALTAQWARNDPHELVEPADQETGFGLDPRWQEGDRRPPCPRCSGDRSTVVDEHTSYMSARNLMSSPNTERELEADADAPRRLKNSVIQ